MAAKNPCPRPIRGLSSDIVEDTNGGGHSGLKVGEQKVLSSWNNDYEFIMNKWMPFLWILRFIDDIKELLYYVIYMKSRQKLNLENISISQRLFTNEGLYFMGGKIYE